MFCIYPKFDNLLFWKIYKSLDKKRIMLEFPEYIEIYDIELDNPDFWICYKDYSSYSELWKILKEEHIEQVEDIKDCWETYKIYSQYWTFDIPQKNNEKLRYFIFYCDQNNVWDSEMINQWFIFKNTDNEFERDFDFCTSECLNQYIWELEEWEYELK